jgi:thiamine biosynthesis lipoprotein
VTLTADGRIYRWRAMASPISLHLPDLPDRVGEAVARAAAADIEASEQAMSRFREESELVQLNARMGEWVEVSPRLYKALSASWQAGRRTDGLFDPRVLRTLEALGYTGTDRVDHPDRPGEWLARAPRRRAVLLRSPIDLGGIGKGLAVRWAANIVRRVTSNYLLNAGGDLLAEGGGPDGEGWQVGVEDPNKDGALRAALRTRGRCAVCTSSIARLRWEHKGMPVHHLIDPRTAHPGGAGLWAVTVLGSDPAWAEVQSKTLFLHGAEGIAAAARGRAAIWITQDGGLHVTDEAEPSVFWRSS